MSRVPHTPAAAVCAAVKTAFAAAAPSAPCGPNNLECDKGTRCFNGFQCCPNDIPVCGGYCCGSPWACKGNICVPPGGTPCPGQNYICEEGRVCMQDYLCCRPTDSVCNNACCPKGKSCHHNQCVNEDEEPCGGRMCTSPSEVCVDREKGQCLWQAASGRVRHLCHSSAGLGTALSSALKGLGCWPNGWQCCQ